MPEVFVGSVMVLGGIFGIVTAFRERVPENPFLDFIGESPVRQRARWLVCGIFACLLGAFLLVRGVWLLLSANN